MFQFIWLVFISLNRNATTQRSYKEPVFLWWCFSRSSLPFSIFWRRRIARGRVIGHNSYDLVPSSPHSIFLEKCHYGKDNKNYLFIEKWGSKWVITRTKTYNCAEQQGFLWWRGININLNGTGLHRVANKRINQKLLPTDPRTGRCSECIPGSSCTKWCLQHTL